MPSRDGRCSDRSHTEIGKDARRSNRRAFLFALQDESGFPKLGRPGHRRHSGPRHRPRPHGRLHERRGLPQDRRDRLRHLLQPLAQQALAEGRKLRPPPGGQGDLHRLRPRRRARQGRGARPRRLPRRLRELLLPPPRRRRVDGSPNRAPTIPTRSTEASREAQARHSQGQPRERHHRSVPPRRLQHHHQQPLLLPRHRRSRRSSAC